ncbi:hypothetical protein ACJQWK_09614 [Exserohilum turcicum]|uniref:3-beta hydroxysteroid dehydrogenase/isomerase domain-containing protein n=1 Tax=Exserohilum turcicum (strain 28A) TaxID=671987 RepID=R0I6D2_EXST2|nr:uncharacterized protein SETTUDRAFT_182151 [Exserohilum turcica Et28A]EOA81071.1 hypothetical protein SETTUDRAFT_182151 [Exserohilum turcica Et28A]
MPLPHVLVTGGCGFVGTAVVSALLDTKRYSVTAVDINPPSLGSPNFSSTHTNVRYVRCDVLDPAALSSVFSETRPVAVIHTVGMYHLGTKRYSMEGRDAVFEVNVQGTRNVLQASKECGVESFVYTSSTTVVLDDLNRDFRNVDEKWPKHCVDTSYGLSKALSEDLVLTSSTPTFLTCALRPPPIFGPNDSTLTPTLHACISAFQTPFLLGTGTNLQDYAYISNVADAHVLATENLLLGAENKDAAGSAAGEALFISNGEPVTARAFCLAVWREFGHVPAFEIAVPERVAWCVGYVAEWVEWATGAPGTLCRGVVSDGCRDRYVCIDKARRVLGYEPRVGLEEGIRITCQHYKTTLQGRRKT